MKEIMTVIMFGECSTEQISGLTRLSLFWTGPPPPALLSEGHKMVNMALGETNTCALRSIDTHLGRKQNSFHLSSHFLQRPNNHSLHLFRILDIFKLVSRARKLLFHLHFLMVCWEGKSRV